MGVLSDYDDLAGYEFGEFSDFLNKQTLTELAVVGATGAAAVLGGTYAAQWLAKRPYFVGLDAVKRARYLSGATALVGLLGGAYLYRKQRTRDIGIAVAAGAAGLALANLVGTFFTTNPLGTPLGEAEDDSLLSGYDFESLNGLAEAVVDPAGAGGVPQLAGVVVDPASLQGYQPWLS